MRKLLLGLSILLALTIFIAPSFVLAVEDIFEIYIVKIIANSIGLAALSLICLYLAFKVEK